MKRNYSRLPNNADGTRHGHGQARRLVYVGSSEHLTSRRTLG
jgi:hypothetical protein